MRGIQLVTAATIVAELGDLRRFGTASELMSYLGLVPSEHSSGDRTHRGHITRAGNTHVRRVLVESAWSYRYCPGLSAALRKRNEGLPQSVRNIAWKAQKRLHYRYCKLKGRGIVHQKVVVTIARELAGFVWAIGH
jgi:transposase